ncbi:MAG: GtrA family protein [Oscillospiraceae bacterium]|nr:GtrA family protein [Oscillospiraceae bacterium]
MHILNKLKQHYWNKNFIIFLIIGVVNTLNGSVFSYVFTKLLNLNANLAFVIGYVCSLTIAYVLNCKFNFRQRLNLAAMLKFFVSYIPNFLIQNAVVFVIFNLLGWHVLIAYVLAAIISIPLTFLIVKYFVFIKKTGKEQCDD